MCATPDLFSSGPCTRTRYRRPSTPALARAASKNSFTRLRTDLRSPPSRNHDAIPLAMLVLSQAASRQRSGRAHTSHSGCGRALVADCRCIQATNPRRSNDAVYTLPSVLLKPGAQQRRLQRVDTAVERLAFGQAVGSASKDCPHPILRPRPGRRCLVDDFQCHGRNSIRHRFILPFV